MSENFLQFIWKFGLFDKSTAKTTDNEKIEILNLGTANTDSGPDFFNAKIKIGEIVWSGNIEIHRNASDWNLHKHNDDKFYDNVILHVVKNVDCKIYRHDETQVPTYKIEYNSAIEQRYTELLMAKTWIPCQNYVKNIKDFRVKYFLGRMLVERLEQRSDHVREILDATKNDFKEVFYRLLFRAFGFGINALPFEILAQKTPIAAINKHRNSVFQMEALLFGQAGFLQGEPLDDYQAKLQNEYKFFKNKFNIEPMEKHVWKFLRLRPTNFPTIRIAQLACFLTQSEGFLNTVGNFEIPNELYEFFNFKASEYWDFHYNFGKKTMKREKFFGKTSADKIVINAITPYLFTYGKVKDNETFCERALDLLEIVAPERNNITSGWQKIGVPSENAFYAQALIQLKTMYCDKKKCLQCPIGKEIICI